MRGALAFVLEIRVGYVSPRAALRALRVEPAAQLVDELFRGLEEGQVLGARNRSGAKTSAGAQGGPLDDGVPQALLGVDEKDGALDG